MSLPEQIPLIKKIEEEHDPEGVVEKIAFDNIMSLGEYNNLQAAEINSDIVKAKAKKHYNFVPDETQLHHYYTEEAKLNLKFRWNNLRHRSDVTEEVKRDCYKELAKKLNKKCQFHQ